MGQTQKGRELLTADDRVDRHKLVDEHGQCESDVDERLPPVVHPHDDPPTPTAAALPPAEETLLPLYSHQSPVNTTCRNKTNIRATSKSCKRTETHLHMFEETPA